MAARRAADVRLFSMPRAGSLRRAGVASHVSTAAAGYADGAVILAVGRDAANSGTTRASVVAERPAGQRVARLHGCVSSA